MCGEVLSDSRTLHTYGIVCYDAYTAARDLAWPVSILPGATTTLLEQRG